MFFKKVLIAGAILLGSVASFSGSNSVLTSDRYRTVYALLPVCDSASSDTLGVIDLLGAKHFSLAFNGALLDYKDTAIVDSGKTVIRFYVNHLNSTSNLYTPKTADSLPDIFGTGVLGTRTSGRSKAISMDATRYLIPVITRTDKLGEILDFKDISGTVNNNVMTFIIIKEVY